MKPYYSFFSLFKRMMNSAKLLSSQCRSKLKYIASDVFQMVSEKDERSAHGSFSIKILGFPGIFLVTPTNVNVSSCFSKCLM